jgi:hypothetical protein
MFWVRRRIVVTTISVPIVMLGILSYARIVTRHSGRSVVRGYVKSKTARPDGCTFAVLGSNSLGVQAEQTVTATKAECERIQAGNMFSSSAVTGRWYTYNDDPTIQQ